jgi:translation elongation factor EF-Tu-like GTPase
VEPPPYRRPHRSADLEVRISYLSTDAGGRKTAVASGIRPDHDFGLTGELHGAQHEYPEQECVAPGTSATALLWLIAPDLQKGGFHPGLRFTVQEGPKVIGYGEVVAVLNKELARDS